MTELDLMCKQMLEFNKTITDNSFKLMFTCQEQNEKMMDGFMDRSSWIPEEGKQLTKELYERYKKGCADFQKTTDDYFKRAMSNFEPPSSSQKSEEMDFQRSGKEDTDTKKASPKSSTTQSNKK
jgi:hypothetical protein